MDIHGVGPRLLVQLVQAGLLQDVGDFYGLTSEQLLSLEGVGEKSARNILEAIDQSRRPTLGRLLRALGIRRLGQQNAFMLAARFGTLQNLQSASQSDLIAIPGIGPERARSVYDYFQEPGNAVVLQKLFDNGVKIDQETLE
jgi:DNA ligase (NAD+)